MDWLKLLLLVLALAAGCAGKQDPIPAEGEPEAGAAADGGLKDAGADAAAIPDAGPDLDGPTDGDGAPADAPDAAAALLAVLPRPAWACSHPFCASEPYLALPEDGADDVPVNAVVVIRWGEPYGCCEKARCWESFQLQTASGMPVPSAAEWDEWGIDWAAMSSFRLAPHEPLLPGTAYEVVANGFPFNDDVVGSFTTGAVTDTGIRRRPRSWRSRLARSTTARWEESPTAATTRRRRSGS
jgi:hypothetical protein